MAAADGNATPLVAVSDRARELVLAYRGSSDKPNPERLAMWIESHRRNWRNVHV